MDKEKMFELYREGISLRRIAKRMSVPKDEIYTVLKEYKDSQFVERVKKTLYYFDELKQLIIDRYTYRLNTAEVAEELDLKTPYVRKVLIKNDEYMKHNDNPYEEIKWDRIDKCPHCGNEKLNDLHSHYKDAWNYVPVMYCKNCNIEMKKIKGKIYQVDWAYVN